MESEKSLLRKRQLPKIMACMTKTSLENLRNKALFNLDVLDAKGIRRRKLPLHECLILELKEKGFYESSDYLQDLIYDNIQILADDEIGIVIDLREKSNYLEHICAGLKKAEKYRDKENKKEESQELLKLALYYEEQGKGILWLAEKFFLASIAVASQYLLDGGRLKACCKYHYADFLLEKFPDSDPEESFEIFTEVRDSAIGRDWLLDEEKSIDSSDLSNSLFATTVLKLHKVLLNKARTVRSEDPAKAERLCRLAERRAQDATDIPKIAEAIIEIGISQLSMNNLNNALKTFEKAYQMYTKTNNIKGLCESKMHLAAVLQRLGDHEEAAKLLTEMGALAMQHNLRRHLGRALHLLGELHLRRERPELGTQHLAEAFACFMGYLVQDDDKKPAADKEAVEFVSELDVIYKSQRDEIFVEEAEQSRLMMAISAGQELMSSYFNLLKESGACFVVQVKVIEWKLSYAGWWVKQYQHQLVPCLCPAHHRTPLDVLRFQLASKDAETNLEPSDSENNTFLQRSPTTEDIRKLRSSYHYSRVLPSGDVQ